MNNKKYVKNIIKIIIAAEIGEMLDQMQREEYNRYKKGRYFMEKINKLSANALKMIALVTMTIDHTGLLLMNNCRPLRIIGRLAFPIFAYMIAEGCRYTKNKRNYFLRIFLLGLLCQVVYYIAEQNVDQGILMTFSVSILLSYVVLWVENRMGESCRDTGHINKILLWLLPVGLILLMAVICGEIKLLPDGRYILFDYGFYGILLPVLIALGRDKKQRLFLAAAGMTLIAFSLGGIQWYSLIALFPLACYNEKRGKWNLKYLFYIYYPLHMAIIYGLSMLIG